MIVSCWPNIAVNKKQCHKTTARVIVEADARTRTYRHTHTHTHTLVPSEPLHSRLFLALITTNEEGKNTQQKKQQTPESQANRPRKRKKTETRMHEHTNVHTNVHAPGPGSNFSGKETITPLCAT